MKLGLRTPNLHQLREVFSIFSVENFHTGVDNFGINFKAKDNVKSYVLDSRSIQVRMSTALVAVVE